MRLDCEIISQDFLPVLRAVLAKELASCGMNQKEVAVLLDVSQPAVSQYLRDLRGSRKNFVSDQEIFTRIKAICEKIKTEQIDKTGLKNELYAICEVALNRTRS